MSRSRYVFEELLGGGAFGRVWRARDDHGRERAVKFFIAPSADDRERQALEHATALIRVQHSAVVRVFAVERLPHPDTGLDQLAIVMELVEGIDLAHFAETLTLSRAKMFAEQLAAGLQAIHDAGLIHDDIHSGNVLLTDKGAKLLDIAYTRTLAGAGASTRVRSYREDTRDFVRVVRELVERVPELDRKLAMECHFQAERGAQSPAQVLQFFATLWVGHSLHEDATARLLRTGPVHLLVCRTDPDGTDYSTYVAVGGEIVATLPQLALICHGKLLILQKRSREVFILRQHVLDRWHESTHEPTRSDYERTFIFSPRLETTSGSRSIELATDDPVDGSDEILFTFYRGVYVTGFVGPYLFVEQLDYKFGGGPHPDSNRRHHVIDVRSGVRPIKVFSDSERNDLMSREGLVAKEAFIRLRDDAPLFSEMEVDLSASCPTFEGTACGLRLVFTTFTSYVQSEPRWSSYFLAEEVQARRLPELLQEYANIPAGVAAAMRAVPGYPIGWSAAEQDDGLLNELAGVLAVLSGTASNAKLAAPLGTILNQHNGPAPWRSGYFALEDEDLAKEVGAELSQRSRTKEDALARLPGQLETELAAADRRLNESEFLAAQLSATSVIEEFFAQVPRQGERILKLGKSVS